MQCGVHKCNVEITCSPSAGPYRYVAQQRQQRKHSWEFIVYQYLNNVKLILKCFNVVHSMQLVRNECVMLVGWLAGILNSTI